VIPHNVRHGEDLICSYEQCRNAGNKFRYCAECRIPVAKRNFHQRHGHGLVCVTTSDPKPPRAGMDTELKRSLKAPPTTTAAGPSAKLSKKQPGKRKQMGSSTDSNNSSSGISQPQATQKRRKDSSARAASSSDTGPLYPDVGDIPFARQLRWATLLGKRPNPDDADGMSAWLLEVMAVSDLQTPLGNFASSSLTNSGSGESVGFSNSDSPEMGSSVNSSLSTDVLTSDVSSEEAVQDCHKKESSTKEAPTTNSSLKKRQTKPHKSDKERRKHRHNEDKVSKKESSKAVRRQEKKLNAQRGRAEKTDDRMKRSSKDRMPFDVEYAHSRKKKKTGKKKAKKSTDVFKDDVPASQMKLFQAEVAQKQQEDLSNDSPDNEDLCASYAEWQERKKQKASHKPEASAGSEKKRMRTTLH